MENAHCVLDTYPGSSAMIQAYQSLIKLLMMVAHTKRKNMAQKTLERTKDKIHPLHYLELQSQYANRLLLDGYESEATNLLEEILEQAILQKSHLVIIAQGIILTSLWMKKEDLWRLLRWRYPLKNRQKKGTIWLALAVGA